MGRMSNGDQRSDLLAEWGSDADAPPRLSTATRRGLIVVLTGLAVVLAPMAFLTSVGYAIVVGVPLEIVSVSSAIAVVCLTTSRTKGRRLSWLLLAVTLIPVGLTIAFLITIELQGRGVV